MKFLKHHSSFILAFAFLGTVIVSGVISWQRASAEFEVPLIDTNNFTPTDFRDIWSFYRAERFPPTLGFTGPDDTSGTVYEFPQAFAVGPNELGAGSSLYQLRNGIWEQVLPTDALDGITRFTIPKTYNAITGQYDFGTGYPQLFMGGKNESTGVPAIVVQANTRPDRPDLIANDFTGAAAVSIINGAPAAGEIYAMDAVQTYRGQIFAGGTNGLFLYHTGYTPDTWQAINLSTLLGISVGDITDIAFVSPSEAYVTTTDFSAAGLKPYDHTCAATRVSRLFRVIGDPATASNWDMLTPAAGVVGSCFYRMAATPFPNFNSTGFGPAYSKIWIATNLGIRIFHEAANCTGTKPTAGLQVCGAGISGSLSVTAQQLYGISVTANLAGDANLVVNGAFSNWSRANPDINDATIDPDQWQTTDESNFGRNNPTGTCGKNTRDLMIVAGEFAGNDRAVKVEPGIYYNSAALCGSSTNPRKDASASYFQRIPLTNIEGTKFRVTGKYKVTITDPTGNFPQGGILTQCVGANPPGSVDCSFSNFSQVRTSGTGGAWITFSYDVTRNDIQLQAPLQGHTGSPRVYGSGQFLEVRCYATYGASVLCDNIGVTVINTPAIVATYPTTVVGVGDQGAIYVNADALSSDTFSTEMAAAVGTPPLTAVTALSSNLVYTVGEDSRFLQRVAGNITGFIWAGTGSPTVRDVNGNPTQRKALGWISTNCANHRDAQDRSLCQRARSSFGVVMQNNRLSGQAWFGKSYEAGKPNDDIETLNLGSCLRPAQRVGTGLTGFTMTNSCNTATRTCFQDSTKACMRDFDCYGRCEFDQGTICLTNGDCQIGATPVGGINVSNSRLTRPPSDSLRCANGLYSNPAACTSGGWLSFNVLEMGTPPAAIEASGLQRNSCGPARGVCFDTNTSQLRGTARFLTTANANDPNADVEGDGTDRGWVSFRGPAGSAPSALSLPVGNSLFSCQQCTTAAGLVTCKFCQDTNRQSCRPLANTCTNYCEGTTPGSVDLSDACTIDDECNPGKSCRPVGFCSEDPSTQCSGDTGCVNKGYCAIGATCLAAGATCTTYGVNLNTISGQFSGYAWSADYGWLDFRGLSLGTRRFVQTKLGDVYSQQDIGDINTLPAPGSTCNATYVISATGTINNFCSTFFVDSSINFKTVEPLADLIPFASERNQFANALGRIDLVGLEKNVGSAKNKFGATLVDLPDSGNIADELGSSSSKVLGGSVYVAGTAGTTANFSIDSDLTFDSGSGVTFNGSGVVIVNGNLRVNANIHYDSSNIDDLRKVANAVFIVKGNLIIDNRVTKLAGNFYVSGTVCTGQPSTGSDPCSASITSSNSFPLEVRGIMIAQEFFLARRFAGTIENPLPSELFISDGRLQANPPPGLLDFAGSLPNTINTGP